MNRGSGLRFHEAGHEPGPFNEAPIHESGKWRGESDRLRYEELLQ